MVIGSVGIIIFPPCYEDTSCETSITLAQLRDKRIFKLTNDKDMRETQAVTPSQQVTDLMYEFDIITTDY